MVMIRCDSVEREVASSSEISESSSKQEAGLEQHLGSRTFGLWDSDPDSLGPSEAQVAELEPKAAGSQASRTCLFISLQLE